MEPRQYTCMSHGSVRLWPPNWKWTSGADNIHRVGEIGVFERQVDRDWGYDLLCELLPDYYGQPLPDIGELYNP